MQKVFPTPLSKTLTHFYISGCGVFVPLSIGADVLDKVVHIRCKRETNGLPYTAIYVSRYNFTFRILHFALLIFRVFRKRN